MAIFNWLCIIAVWVVYANKQCLTLLNMETKCQTQGFETAVHKPMGDATVTTSTSSIQSIVLTASPFFNVFHFAIWVAQGLGPYVLNYCRPLTEEILSCQTQMQLITLSKVCQYQDLCYWYGLLTQLIGTELLLMLLVIPAFSLLCRVKMSSVKTVC